MHENQWQYLQQQLHTYTGQYECHLTVELGLNATSQLQLFEQLCEELDAKSIIIQLDSGETPTQPMLCRFFDDKPTMVLSAIQNLADKLQQHFKLVRLKVEASPNNTHIPQTDDDIIGLSKSCYFEHHVKMLLPDDTDLATLRADLKTYHGHLSRNAFSAALSPRELSTRFVTQRFWCGNTNAKQQLDALLGFLQQRQITVSKVIREFNIFDSHADLDAGWITP